MKPYLGLLAGLAAISLAACSGSSIQSSLEPPTTTVNPLNSTLQFEVGTANIAGVVGLNTLVTLRQTTAGYVGSSLLSNAPTITGPASFKVPAAPDALGDAGTNHISAFIPTNIASPPPLTTFDPDGCQTPSGCGSSAQGNYLASSYGFFPGVVANSGLTPSLQPGPMPFYVVENPGLAAPCTASSYSGPASLPGCKVEYIGGPPAFVQSGHTSTQDGTYPGGYDGFTLGFVDFQAVPVSGIYSLSVVIPTGINSNGVESYGTKTATSTLTASKVLAPWTTAPTFTTDGTGGGTITANFTGSGSGLATEEYLEIVDEGPASCQLSGSPPYYYTFKVTPGTATVAVPDDIGAAPPGHAQGHTFCTASDNGGGSATADQLEVYGFAVDYPLYSSAFPQSDNQAAPTIVGSAGQDDVTTSPVGSGSEGISSSSRYRRTSSFVRRR
jgi:hypothetical protein